MGKEKMTMVIILVEHQTTSLLYRKEIFSSFGSVSVDYPQDHSLFLLNTMRRASMVQIPLVLITMPSSITQPRAMSSLLGLSVAFTSDQLKQHLSGIALNILAKGIRFPDIRVTIGSVNSPACLKASDRYILPML